MSIAAKDLTSAKLVSNVTFTFEEYAFKNGVCKMSSIFSGFSLFW